MITMEMMKRLPSVTVKLGDDEYDFCLTPLGCQQIERNTQCGIFQVFKRMLAGECHATDSLAVIEQAIYDSGLSRKKDEILNHFAGKPIAATTMPAVAILAAAIHGVDESGD